MITTFKGAYRFLSNFHLVDIEFRGTIYPSVEHAYMSAKSDDPMWKAYCANKNISPTDVKRESKTITLVPNWNGDIKYLVMEECLRVKFAQEPFRTALLMTGKENLQEGNTWDDRTWGVDLTVNPNIGENHLGRLLMKIRDDIRLSELQ